MAPAEQYDRFVGRFLPALSVALADLADVRPGMRVVDVGCGPGGLTVELTTRVGADNVAGIDPAAQFAAACRERNPGADIRDGVAEARSPGRSTPERCIKVRFDTRSPPNSASKCALIHSS
jgi:trans-aconitate methyltransferase